MTQQRIEVSCSAGCKRWAELPGDGTPPPGWELLPIAGRYRCANCWRDLTAAQQLQGTPSEFAPDPLPPGSRGALKKLPEPPALREEVRA